MAAWLHLSLGNSGSVFILKSLCMTWYFGWGAIANQGNMTEHGNGKLPFISLSVWFSELYSHHESIHLQMASWECKQNRRNLCCPPNFSNPYRHQLRFPSLCWYLSVSVAAEAGRRETFCVFLLISCAAVPEAWLGKSRTFGLDRWRAGSFAK